VAGSAVVVATATVLIRRLRRAAHGQRRVLAPLYSYGVVAVLFIPLSGAVLRPLLGMSPETLVVLQLVVLAGVPVAFVLGMLRGGFARTGEVEELAAWLGSSAPARPGLTEALARALGDDSLELVFWVPEQRGYVDADGRAVTLPAAGSDRAAAEVELADRRVGAIVYDATLIADAELVRAAGRVVGLAVDRERLTAELRASEDALRRSRVRIVEAADRERRRIARNLHDGLQVRLVVLALQAQQVADRGEGPLRDAATALRAGVDEAAADLRALVHAVMPAALVERGLAAATEDLVDRMPLPTRLDMSIADGALPAAVESTAYFVVAEGLANALKHAEPAGSRSAWPVATGTCASRSATTAAAGPYPAPVPASAGWPTGSTRSAAGCGWTTSTVAAPGSWRSSRADRDRGGRGAAAPGSHPRARARGTRGPRGRRRRGRAGPAGGGAAARPGRHRHPHAAPAHRRRTGRRAAHPPGTAVVVLSQHVQRRYAMELLGERPSGVGYLLKQRIADVETFCADLERVRAGSTVLDPEVVALILARARHDHALGRLTPRQHEVLALMAEGRSNAAIARRLSITEKAVVGHVSRIYDELDLPPSDDDHRRVLAVLRHLSR
jgi:signal transduction histidine kinase/DNA-binding NarL/FixJ family response regulator